MSNFYPYTRRTRVRRMAAADRPGYGVAGALRSYLLILQHRCHDRRCRCPATAIAIWDQGAESVRGLRWLVTCDTHGTRAFYGRLEAASIAARDCSFCPECRRALLRNSRCSMCGAPTRGCAMCLPRSTE